MDPSTLPSSFSRPPSSLSSSVSASPPDKDLKVGRPDKEGVEPGGGDDSGRAEDGEEKEEREKRKVVFELVDLEELLLDETCLSLAEVINRRKDTK